MTDSIALFRPLRMVITNVTNTRQAIVTTAIANQYNVDDKVRLLIPASYGMSLDQVVKVIGIVNPFNFISDLDSSTLDVFSVPVVPSTPAQSIPVQGVDFNAYDSLPVNPTVFIASLT